MAEFQPLTITNEREVSADDLTLDQLINLKQQHEDEIKELSSQLEQLYGAKSRYINSKNVIDDLSQTSEESTILVPLTSSLYAPGVVQLPKKVIVELGTGYFVEKNVSDAKELITRKVNSVLSFFSSKFSLFHPFLLILSHSMCVFRLL